MSEHSNDKPVTFSLNGKSVVGQPGETLLAIARREGVAIPTLCHHESVTPYGACRLCVVEVSWGKRSKMVTSCIYIPYEGDQITTDNEAVRRLRAMILELLWSRHPKVEAVAALAREYGVTETRFPSGEPEEIENCIHCGLCVRYCNEVKQKNAVGIVDRGARKEICFIPEIAAQECWDCKECFPLCPTEALQAAYVLSQALFTSLK